MPRTAYAPGQMDLPRNMGITISTAIVDTMNGKYVRATTAFPKSLQPSAELSAAYRALRPYDTALSQVENQRALAAFLIGKLQEDDARKWQTGHWQACRLMVDGTQFMWVQSCGCDALNITG